VETYERIEDEQARLQSGDGLGEVAAVGIQIEPDGRRGDDLDVEIGQRYTGCCRDAFEASAHDMQYVLVGKQQDPTGTPHGEAAQTWDAGGDRDGEVQGQERLAALWLAAPTTFDTLPIKYALSRIANRRNAARTRLSKKKHLGSAT
jgi:hypothetical protein